ncbi:protein yippee-like 5 isoform X1 [Lathamus discolor]|uniref:protein yippee-like 5 isoform X1 n=1 Tax=Lathamus discolor TaxID=678569 RepID=UPI0032B77D16
MRAARGCGAGPGRPSPRRRGLPSAVSSCLLSSCLRCPQRPAAAPAKGPPAVGCAWPRDGARPGPASSSTPPPPATGLCVERGRPSSGCGVPVASVGLAGERCEGRRRRSQSVDAPAIVSSGNPRR